MARTGFERPVNDEEGFAETVTTALEATAFEDLGGVEVTQSPTALRVDVPEAVLDGSWHRFGSRGGLIKSTGGPSSGRPITPHHEPLYARRGKGRR